MDFEPEYVTTQTDDIVISACQAFLEEDEADGCGYYLRIENNSDDRIQILGKDFNKFYLKYPVFAPAVNKILNTVKCFGQNIINGILGFISYMRCHKNIWHTD